MAGLRPDDLVDPLEILDLFLEHPVFQDEGLLFQGLADQLQNLPGFERLLNVVEGPVFHGRHRRVHGSVPRDQNDFHLRPDGLGHLQKLHPVHFRHL